MCTYIAVIFALQCWEIVVDKTINWGQVWGTVINICNPSYLGVEVGGSRQRLACAKSARPYLKNKLKQK
jgi:hypothetical protein